MYNSCLHPSKMLFSRQFSKNILRVPNNINNMTHPINYTVPNRTFNIYKSCYCEKSGLFDSTKRLILLYSPKYSNFTSRSGLGIRNYYSKSPNPLYSNSRKSLINTTTLNNSILHHHNVNIAQQRSFRVTSQQNAIPPAVVLMASRFAKFGAALLGRKIRTWWSSLTPEQKAIHKQRLKNYRNVFGGFVGAFFLALFIYHETHIQEAPFTKRKRFVAFNPEQFDQIAKQEFELMLQLHKNQIVPASRRNPAYYRVVKVAERLLDANKDLEQIRRKEWTITVVDDPTVQNAFVLPCGNIFVFTGMLDICDNDDELGVVLGHEMAHAVLGHGAENASNMHLLDIFMVIPIAMLWAILPTDVGAVIFSWLSDSIRTVLVTLPYARLLEIEADDVGLILAAKACFDVRHGVIFWDKMAAVSEMKGIPEFEWLSSHPNHSERKAHIESKLNEALQIRQDCRCGKLPYLDFDSRVAAFRKKMSSTETFDNVAIRLRVKE